VNAFEFTLRIRMGDHRAQLNVDGGGSVVLIECSGNVALKSAVTVRVSGTWFVAANRAVAFSCCPAQMPVFGILEELLMGIVPHTTRSVPWLCGNTQIN
jgi:hypothetical protein